ncbi:phospholipase A [Acinetobacter lwoffii]|uniref:phospholipase A n=1 Tax=Acinetobacter lwoffii TaxID=28090 RepID=UPI0001BBA3AF|nr:phospholipase A [Acinetobacter lwoffii]EEY89859.1 phospholipase A1 [Acinetobacter lwoffii SH145]MCU4615253.1 phospholipase A [Acinetobacter lwoffii]NKS45510.1 phospholipase [Acinetobacter lwoffii]QGR76175.1 phospholipase [Acinetobacter lwoffii]QKT97572.1 phospholipase A [Acinetobacter lwoffii]
MALNSFKRSTLQLSVLLGCAVGTQVNAEETVVNSPTPATAEACAALEISAERLACYDTLFKIPVTDKPAIVSERRAAAEIAPQPDNLKAKIGQTVSNIYTSEGSKLTPNLSLLDSRWELSPESKLGTWNIRSYQPVYLMPGFWTSNKNELPESENPNNIETEKQNLTSTEAKFQLSLKTKAVENILGDNGDLWLGYTQSSRWQVYNSEESRPFRETNYEPEASLIFRTNYDLLGLNWRMLGLTINHQSNGRSDPLSRSWNRVMLNLGFEKDNFALMVRPWYRFEEKREDDNNPEIKNYIGRGDMTAFYRYKEHDFSLMLRHTLKGGDENRGAVQFDWSFPISGRLRGQFQLFDGYGESLIDYNHRATYVGLGVSLMNWF